MNKLENLKFRVKDAEQNERLQRILQSLGYDWEWHEYKGTVQPVSTLFANSQKMHLFLGAVEDNYEWQDTEAFIEQHTERQANNEEQMKAAMAKPRKEVFLEDAFSGADEGSFFTQESLITEAPWIGSDGTMPDLPDDACVDVMFADESVYKGYLVGSLRWEDIIKWRFNKPEDSVYYKQPKTVLPPVHLGTCFNIDIDNLPKETPVRNKYIGVGGKPTDDLMKMRLTPQHVIDAIADLETHTDTPAAIDSHYNFTYVLTQDDVSAGQLRVDPYFVSQQWRLGSKDNTGVIFHIMKNISRFGDKNTKEREIIAIFKSILRLADLEKVKLEGVTL